MTADELHHPTLHRTWTEVALGAIRHNIELFREWVGPGCVVMPTLKADAYGHGSVPVARAATRAGAERLAVATCLEGQVLREAGIGVPIHILGATLPEEVEAAVRLGLTLSIHEMHIAELAAIAAHRHGRTVPVHCKIDTGMGRLGILPDDAVRLVTAVAALPGLQVEGLFMHFAEAGDAEFSQKQIDEFEQVTARLRAAGLDGLVRHASSTAAVVRYPEANFDMVRPGSGVYGYIAPAEMAGEMPLRQALSWKSSVIQVKEYPAGHTLGYDRTYTTSRPTRVAILPVGYADGYRRENSNRAMVLIRGQRAPVVGRVSMDYTMVDVTELPDIAVGAVATLLGPDRDDRITTEELADWGNTIPHCVTTGISPRVGRVYVD
ncbi:MAG: alanine racemase [Planctomycetaceae bacterium]|nr:alanine racemase [Planctomycetaceae bacterium]